MTKTMQRVIELLSRGWSGAKVQRELKCAKSTVDRAKRAMGMTKDRQEERAKTPYDLLELREARLALKASKAFDEIVRLR